MSTDKNYSATNDHAQEPGQEEPEYMQLARQDTQPPPQVESVQQAQARTQAQQYPGLPGAAGNCFKQTNAISGYSSGYSADQGYSGVAPACTFGGGDSFIIFQNVRSSSGEYHLTNIYNLNPL